MPLPGQGEEEIADKRAARDRDAKVAASLAGEAYTQARKAVLTEEESLAILKERAKTDPDVKARLEMQGVTFDE